jgi:hypothetical protein
MQLALLRAVVAAVLLAVSVNSPAAGKAYRVDLWPVGGVEGATGDREEGADGAFWIASAEYDNPTGGWTPFVQRLAPSGALSRW